MKISKELVTGSIPIMVLSTIEKQDLYGYMIVRELKLRSEDVFVLKEGTLYPVLHSLEKEGYAESYWSDAEGRKSKYYHITKKGLRHLASKKEEFAELTSTVTRVLNYAL